MFDIFGRLPDSLAETIGRETTTVHRLLEADPKEGGSKRREQNPVECDLLMGDVGQLPSVGPGQVLADIIASKAV